MTQEPRREDLGSDVPGGISFFGAGPEQETRDGPMQAQLVERILAGDETAFSIVAEQYGNLLLRTAYLIVRDDEMAKDIVQDSLVLAWKNMSKLRERSYLRAWLLKIVVNQSMSMKRQLARKAAVLRSQFLQQHVDANIQRSDFQRGRVEDTLDVLQAIGQLPLDQRVVLVLFYYHRMTMPEISSMLGVAENTLRKRLQSAVQKLRRALLVETQEDASQESMNGRVSMHRGGNGR